MALSQISRRSAVAIPRAAARLALIGAILFSLTPSGSTAASHPEVQAALHWRLPPNVCREPELRGNPSGIPALSGSVRHLATNTTAETFGTPVVADVGPLELKRYERQRRRWERCVREYKEALLASFERLKRSARHGLTRSQANLIAGNLALIQAAIISPDGRIGDSRPPNSRAQRDIE